MRAPDTGRIALLALALLALLVFASPGLAEEEPVPEDDAAAEPVDPEEARRLAKALDKAAKRRKGEDVLPLLEELDDRSDPLFVKPLLKMLKHVNEQVAIRAAQALGAQRPATEKEVGKLVKAIWKTGWNDRANKSRYTVKGAAVLAIGRLEKAPLNTSRFKDVKSMWQRVIGDPNVRHAPGLIAICEYVRVTEDKRFCRMLAEEIDNPTEKTIAVDSPSNPPEEWHKRRWEMWRPMKAEVVESLEELTGESFKDTASAKAWFEEHGREFGFTW